MRRQLCELGPDLVEAQADPLGENDEGDTSQHCSWKAALSAASAFGRNESALLIETKRGSGDTAATRHFADKEQVIHLEESTASRP
jgi:hypothetical protein